MVLFSITGVFIAELPVVITVKPRNQLSSAEQKLADMRLTNGCGDL